MPDPAAVQMLLQQAEKICAIRQEQLRRTGGSFNIFTILDIETKEVQTHNRFLYELLNPQGSHGMGDRFLREFFTIVLNASYPDTGVQVRREYSCSAGQIDLLLFGEDFCYPIEIKINAPDQPLQMKRYADYAASRAGDSWVFYLTLDGRPPSEDSTGGSAMDLTCLAFGREIRTWLVQCGKAAWQVPAVSGMIQQYIQLIDKLTNRMEDIYMDMIKDMVGSSRAGFESAMAIAGAVTAAKADLLRKIFSGIKEHIHDRMELSWYDYDSRAELYSAKPQEKNAPYLTYKLAKFDTLTLCFEVLIDWRMYYSIYFMDEEGAFDTYNTDRLPTLLPTPACKEWITSLEKDETWWRFLPDADIDLLPDFHNCNSPYLDLFDRSRFDAWMQRVCADIDCCIEKMTETGLLGYEGSAVRRRKPVIGKRRVILPEETAQ